MSAMWRVLILLCATVVVNGDEERILKTRQGPVRGRRDPMGVDVYLNIPYALVPKGSHKFSEPLPAPAWLQPLNTTDKDILCPQFNTGFKDFDNKIVQEECLITNVYVPVTDEKNLPVIVYIHGGAFEMGFGNMLTPKNLVKAHNVIVVTFNYRLGIHGFLCLGTDAIPGNAGLKDQIALLKWVQRYITSYGGDPENVSLAGYSAGSVSAHLLMLSKSTRGLFSKVILESGANVGSVAIQRDPLENAKYYAKKINCTDVDDVYALQQCYVNAPLESLLSITFFDRKDASILFGPCVERKSKSAVLDQSPVNIITKGEYRKIPLLLGIANMEGSLQIPKFGDWKNEMNKKFSDFLPADLYFRDEEQKDEVAKYIKEFYFGDQTVSESTILPYVDYFSDIMFGYPTWRAVKLHAESGHKDIYLYEYSFVDDSTDFIPNTKEQRAGHCAQTISVFDGGSFVEEVDEDKVSKELKENKAKIREMWYNFAMYGKPVPEGSSLPTWPVAGIDGSPFISLGNTIQLQESFLASRGRFWDDIYDKYYKEPVPPPKPPHTEL